MIQVVPAPPVQARPVGGRQAASDRTGEIPPRWYRPCMALLGAACQGVALVDFGLFWAWLFTHVARVP